MERTYFILVIGAAVSVFCFGCHTVAPLPQEPECSVNEDCPVGEFCDEEECAPFSEADPKDLEDIALDELTPLLYFPFDGNADDASGNENHGIAQGVTEEPGTRGADGTDLAFRFDGDGSYVEFPDVIDAQADRWTFSIWLKLRRLPTWESDAFLFTRKSVQTNEDTYLFVNNDENEVQSWSQWGRARSGIIIDPPPEGDEEGDNAEWVHIAAVHTLYQMIYYVDGVKSAAVSHSFATTYPADSPYLIGCICDNCEGGPFGDIDPDKGRIWGDVDDVRLYDVALSADHVAQLYQMDMPN